MNLVNTNGDMCTARNDYLDGLVTMPRQCQTTGKQVGLMIAVRSMEMGHRPYIRVPVQVRRLYFP